MINPFKDLIGEDQTFDTINELFVKDNSCISRFKQYYHTFIWGSRGSGKSILLKYYDFKNQILQHGGFENLIIQEDMFIGVYLKLDSGTIDSEPFSKLKPYIKNIISEHYLIMLVCEKIWKDFFEHIPNARINNEERKKFVREILDLLFFESNYISELDAIANREDDLYRWMLSFFHEEKKRVESYLSDFTIEKVNVEFKGHITNYHTFLYPFIKMLKNLFMVKEIPIFLMFDDACYMFEFQQQILNGWIASRQHNDICIKVATEPLDYLTFRTLKNSIIERVHDYTEISLDYKTKKQRIAFLNHIVDIGDRRLLLFSKKYPNFRTIHINDLFEEDESQKKLIVEIKREILVECEEVTEIKDKERHMSRHTMPRLHRQRKRSYAGLNNIVDIASGNTRDFLMICFNIFESKLSNINSSIKSCEKLSNFVSIEATIQDKVISELSKEFVLDITDERTRYDSKLLVGLDNLLKNIISLMIKRLLSPLVREPSASSFIISNQMNLDDYSKEVLRTGIRLRYFKRSTYSSKSFGDRQDVFILNKLLFPEYNLNTSEEGGRLVFSDKEISDAIQNVNIFKKIRWEFKTLDLTINQISLFENLPELLNRESDDGEEYENEYRRLF